MVEQIPNINIINNNEEDDNINNIYIWYLFKHDNGRTNTKYKYYK